MYNNTIGFIGFGNMASAMAKGLLHKNAVSPANIFACAKHFDKLEKKASSMGINACHSPEEVVEQSEIVVISVKPYMVKDVMEPLRDKLEGKIIFSVAAGLSFDDIETIIPGSHHCTAIPNTPVSVCEGIYICEEKHSLTDVELELVEGIFSTTGLMVRLEPRQYSPASTLAGCGPAFAAMFIEALADGALKNGLPRALAYQLASQMLCGTAKLQLETQEHPGAMKDAVCSPGGQTIRGVAALEEGSFRSTVIKAIDVIEEMKR